MVLWRRFIDNVRRMSMCTIIVRFRVFYRIVDGFDGIAV